MKERGSDRAGTSLPEICALNRVSQMVAAEDHLGVILTAIVQEAREPGATSSRRPVTGRSWRLSAPWPGASG
jgi:hypothetical protein